MCVYSDQDCCKEQRPIAVHFNFKTGQLSVRDIGPSGKLGGLIQRTDEIVLNNAEFTVDQDKWQKWKNGNKHASQFAEVRGTVSTARPIVKIMDPVLYKPHARFDFHDMSGDTITDSKTVLISSKLGIFKYDYLAL